jgi:enoyl-CoA hydratase
VSDLVRVDQRGHLLVIGVDRVDKRNAWNRQIIREVAEAYDRLGADPDLRVGVVHGLGEHFSAGLDLVDVLPALTGDGGAVLPAGSYDPWDFFGEPCPKPVVLAVQGTCFTLGIELALASQVTIAASDTVFAQLEVARAIVPLGGGSYRLPRRLGAQGMRWMLSAERFDAPAALAAGLVSEVVEPGHQLDRAIEVAETIAGNAPLAVQAALASARAAERPERDAAAAVIREAIGALVASADAGEGVAAMLERRVPRFEGR